MRFGDFEHYFATESRLDTQTRIAQLPVVIGSTGHGRGYSVVSVIIVDVVVITIRQIFDV